MKKLNPRLFSVDCENTCSSIVARTKSAVNIGFASLLVVIIIGLKMDKDCEQGKNKNKIQSTNHYWILMLEISLLLKYNGKQTIHHDQNILLCFRFQHWHVQRTLKLPNSDFSAKLLRISLYKKSKNLCVPQWKRNFYRFLFTAKLIVTKFLLFHI